MDLRLASQTLVRFNYSIYYNICSYSFFIQEKPTLYDFALMDIAPSDDSEAQVEAYINEISQKATKYIGTRSVWRQYELKNILNGFVNEEKGKFWCLLGGVNTGKSLVLSELTRNTNQSVALIDMRGTSSILKGLTWSFNEDNSAVFNAALLEVLKTLPSPPSVAGSLVTDNSTPDARLAYFLEKKYLSDTEKLGMLLSEVAEVSPKNKAGCGLTLIIDEANVPFKDRSDKDDARRALPLFAGLTKQDHEVSVLFFHIDVWYPYHALHICYACTCCQINVILVSSGDITFPYSLHCSGFSSRDISRFIFTSEVSVV